MKKVLSIVLSLVMVLCMMPAMAFADTAVYSDIAGTTCEEAVTTLSGLGVVDGYPDGSYKPEATVTRAEAAKLIVAALGLTDQAAGYKASFTDLDGYAWAEGFIGYAEDLGILKGDGNGLYRPGDVVSYNEMAAIVIRALGYSDDALQGTFPAAHVAKAKQLGVFADVVSGGAAGADRGDCAIMIFNVLGSQIGYTDKDGVWHGFDGDAMVIRLGAKSVETDAIVDLADARNSAVDLTSYYGVKADLYKDAKGKVIAIANIDSTVLEGKFSSDLKTFESNGVKYDVKAALAPSMKYKNAVADTSVILGGNDIQLACEISGKTITVVHSMSDWAGTDIQWSANDVKTVAKAVSPSMTGYGALPLNTSKTIDYTMFDLVGADSLTAIPEKAIVTYYTAAGTTPALAKVEVSTATVVGKVTAVNKVNGDVTINGTVYPVCSPVAIGSEGTFYLNYAGEVCVYEPAATATSYGYVVKNMLTESTYAAPTYVDILKEDGSTATMTVDKDEVGVTITTGNFTAPKFVEYSLNAAGEIETITDITTALTTATSFTNAKYDTDGYLGGKRIASDVVVFVGTNATNMKVGSLSDIPADTAFTAGAVYGLIVDDADDEIEVIWFNGVVDSTVYGTIVDYDQEFNAKDEKVWTVTLADGTKYFTATPATSAFPVNSIYFSSLIKFDLDNGVVQTATPVGVYNSSTQPDGFNTYTVAKVVATGLETDEVGYVKAASNVVVYKPVKDINDTFVKYEVATLADILEDDTVYVYDTNTKASAPGVEYIIIG